MLDAQLRAIYDSYAASEIPQRLLELASQFEEQARRRLEAGAESALAPKDPAPERDEEA